MLSKKQAAVARAVYEGRLSESALCAEHKIKVRQFRAWQEEGEFQAELERLRGVSLKETRFILARFGPIAALRLAELMGSEKADTARRAALDMIDRCLAVEPREGGEREGMDEPEISEEQAERMLLALAEVKEN